MTTSTLFEPLRDLILDRLDLLEGASVLTAEQRQEHHQALGKLLLMVQEYLMVEEQRELFELTGITPAQQHMFIGCYLLSALKALP
jgi:hypothetical protein